MEWEFDSTKLLKITLTAKFSNKASDLDNVAKPTLDALQHVFDWNDKYVYEMHMYKEIVKKEGRELDAKKMVVMARDEKVFDFDSPSYKHLVKQLKEDAA